MGKVNAYNYRVLGKYCPNGRLRNLSWFRIFYKSATKPKKGFVLQPCTCSTRVVAS